MQWAGRYNFGEFVTRFVSTGICAQLYVTATTLCSLSAAVHCYDDCEKKLQVQCLRLSPLITSPVLSLPQPALQVSIAC